MGFSMFNLWPLLLPAAAFSGWWIAYRHYAIKEKKGTHQLSREYVVGLNYLLNEQPDKAVDIFIKLLEVDNDTVETHLALGSLFRRRGEVDRAIKIHQNLIARPQLNILQRKESLMALGEDYMRAGVYDRAEQIFSEIITLGGDQEVNSMQGLLAIYQQEKAWEKSLNVIKKIAGATGNNLNAQTAHYHCEIAAQAIKEKRMEEAITAIKQALIIDKKSVRASLMLAEIEMTKGNYKQAIRSLKQIPKQDAEFLTEIVEPFIYCHRALNKTEEAIDFFMQTLPKHPRASVIFAIGEYLRNTKNINFAIDFVSQQLSHYPSIRGLNSLIVWHLEAANSKMRDKLQILYTITSNLIENKPIYRCGHCGFSGKLLHWHCPSCKQWGKIKPIHGLEGD